MISYFIMSDNWHSPQKYSNLSKSEDNVIISEQRGHSISCCIFGNTTSSSMSCTSNSSSLGDSNSVLMRSRKLVSCTYNQLIRFREGGAHLCQTVLYRTGSGEILCICSFYGNSLDNGV